MAPTRTICASDGLARSPIVEPSLVLLGPVREGQRAVRRNYSVGPLLSLREMRNYSVG